MSTIVTRAGKGSALTHTEVDANFVNLNTDKIEAAQSVTLTNKTIALGSNTVSGTTAQFNTALTDGDFATLAGSETLTNKTISGSSNTLSNIGNASLTNSSVTIGSTSVSLGSTATTVSGLTLSSPTVNTPTLSGGTINNASVGATTPSSGAFTTLSATGVTTVQAGTAAAPSITFSGDTNTGIYSPGADTIAFTEGGVESMRLNSSGNLGPGVTPSTVNNLAGYKSLEIGQPGNIIYAGANQIILASNLKFDGSTGKYGASYPVAAYNLAGSAHTFSSAATGTANANVTVTDVMVVDLGKSLALQGATPQSGTGITFPATQTASSNANTLDDYEEGTFTATLTPGTSGSITLNSIYDLLSSKIGRSVTVVILVDWSAMTGTGILTIGGLPFASANNTQNYACGAVATHNLNWTGGTMMTAFQELNATDITLLYSSDDGPIDRQLCVNESAALRITVTYFA